MQDSETYRHVIYISFELRGVSLIQPSDKIYKRTVYK